MKKSLDKIQISDLKLKTIIPDIVLTKIKYLCDKIREVEWSGILYYKINGSIKDPNNIELILVDILLLDIGTKSHTEYSFDDIFVTNMMNNEELEDCMIGHIHSHNSMSVFFSSEDWSELEDNAPNHNIYLSVIVNNYLDICGKVCFIIETQNTNEIKFTAKDESGNRYIYSNPVSIVDKKLISYDCSINSSLTRSIDNNFIENYNKCNSTAKNNITKSYTWDIPKYNNIFPSNKTNNTITQEGTEDLEYLICELVNAACNSNFYSDNLEKSLLYCISKNITGKNLALSVVSNYRKFYSEIYRSPSEEPSIFIYNTRRVIEILQKYQNKKPVFKVLAQTIEGLKIFLQEFKRLEYDRDTIITV